jgi:predicted adenylyl cyclase CyaB
MGVGGRRIQEIEVKIIAIDRSKVETRLRALEASKSFEGDVETVFFDLPDGSISKANNLLRLRKKGNKSELTFKRFVPDRDAKVREEYEVLVSDFPTTQVILESIGLMGFQHASKHRISYALKDGVTVDLDKYTGEFAHIPDLMEIEAKDIATLRSHIKLLGFGQEDVKSWTTFDLINYYSGKGVKA